MERPYPSRYNDHHRPGLLGCFDQTGQIFTFKIGAKFEREKVSLARQAWLYCT